MVGEFGDGDSREGNGTQGVCVCVYQTTFARDLLIVRKVCQVTSPTHVLDNTLFLHLFYIFFFFVVILCIFFFYILHLFPLVLFLFLECTCFFFFPFLLLLFLSSLPFFSSCCSRLSSSLCSITLSRAVVIPLVISSSQPSLFVICILSCALYSYYSSLFIKKKIFSSSVFSSLTLLLLLPSQPSSRYLHYSS